MTAVVISVELSVALMITLNVPEMSPAESTVGAAEVATVGDPDSVGATVGMGVGGVDGAALGLSLCAVGAPLG